jgi:actin-like ATPase involved in cell morphogenesis
MRVCGIDLGTTNSCIVVVEDDGYRVISADAGAKIFPSVVYVGRDGKPVVGHAARSRLGERPSPVATIKRKMGSLDTVMLGGQSRTPIEVSAMILTFLKELAEKQIGDVLDRAVVTVPAYFNHIQRQQTDEAARKAGFTEVVTLLEPVAAALAYSLESDREHLRVFVYDLGGGTFDATVLEKDNEGGLTVLSFGGDPHLGGDDVDARLAQHITRLLKDQGFVLDLDLDKPEDASRYQRIKFYAELAKRELTDQDAIQLVRQGIFEDQAGATVDLDLTITRADLEACSRDLIARTIEASLEALRKERQEIPLESIDEVVMVGGMSRMPLVRRMLADAIGREPKIVDPDLIVGMGAAIKAAEVFAHRAVSASGLALELRYERNTDQNPARITGVFSRVVKGHTAYLAAGRDELYEHVDGSDRFSFEAVPLTPDSVNVFTLSVEDADEKPILQRNIRITHSSTATPILASPGSVVTKAISIGTVDGTHVLFAENTALPHKVWHAFETADQSGKIVAPIYESDREVERLEIHDIPRQLPIGTRVIIDIAILANYHIEAAASVPDIKREVKIDFDIKPVDTSHITPAYVAQRLEELRRRAAAAVADCPSPDAIRSFEFRFDTTVDEIEAELREIEPKRLRLQEKLAALDLLIRRLPVRSARIELKPSHDEFTERLTKIVTFAIEKAHPKYAEAEPRIHEIRRLAADAWTKRDSVAWRRVNEQVDALGELLQPEVSPADRARGMAAWLVAIQVPELRAAAGGRFTNEIDAVEHEAKMVFISVEAGIVGPPEAINRLIQLYRDRVVPIRRGLGLESKDEPSAIGSMPVGSGALRVAK